jgi:uncharacterized damage-inducible protein DinB
MNRRKLLEAMSVAGLTAAPAAGADWSNSFMKHWHDSFVEHWRDTVEYTLATIDAMPASGYDSKPDPAQRTFGEQMVHLALANVAYFRTLGRGNYEGKTVGRGEPLSKVVNTSDKEAVRQMVKGAMDYVSGVLSRMTESDYQRRDLMLGNKPHSAVDLCLRAYMHTAHHRGQVITYLRVKGITPPTWKFEPKAG